MFFLPYREVAGLRFAGLALARIVVSLAWLLRGAARQATEPTLDRPRKLHGFEVFPGVGTPLSRTTRYGAAFVAAERGGAAMLGWVNYAPIFFGPDTECAVVGGRWFVLAREGGVYRGLLHGSFTGGTVRWNRRAKIARTSLQMQVSGGTRSWRNAYGSGALVAGLNHLPFPPAPPGIGGTLELARRPTPRER